ncbi:MAG TPA: agmatinase [Vicinamibacterales bacterium]|nr:agmatinase [Vicinamibacterales bacterium]
MKPRYDFTDSTIFGGPVPKPPAFEDARAVILPVPFDRTTSYVGGTRNGPREIILASTHMELWDEETGTDVSTAGILTLPEMELPFGEMAPAMDEIQRVAGEIFAADKFLVTLGGEHSITPPVVAAAAARHRGLSVLQIDAHADLRDEFMGSRFNHACAMRRTLEHAPVTQVGIRSLSTEEAQAVGQLKTRIFYDFDMRRDPAWIDRVVDNLSGSVYITIDADGLDPAIMPAVGTPEPGGLSWYETLTLLRAVFRRHTVVACDLVELSPLPGSIAPSFLCAKLVYKMLTYRLAAPSARS